MSAEKYAGEAFSFLAGVKSSDLAMDLAKPRALSAAFSAAENVTGVPRYFLAAIAWTESNFVASAVNRSSGATGLMQLMPFNFAAYGIAANPVDAVGNVRAGAKDLLAKGYGKKPLYDVMRGYNGFKSVNDPVKRAAFDLYYKRICARWAYLATLGALD